MLTLFQAGFNAAVSQEKSLTSQKAQYPIVADTLKASGGFPRLKLLKLTAQV